jgi:CRISPR-associated protein Cmr6
MPDFGGPVRSFESPSASGNALVLWHRCLMPGAVLGTSAKPAEVAPQLRWATTTNLGQEPALVAAAAARRVAAARVSLLPGERAVAIQLVVGSPVLVGAGEKGAHNVGLALHGTYGWPVIRGSSLKGVAQAYARETGASDGDIRSVFGVPGSDDPAEGGVGSVRFYDALPDGKPVKVSEDVLTPHAQEYYRAEGATAPSETANPIPVQFLAVIAGAWRAVLTGTVEGLRLAVKWLAGAVDELGVGAKTSAGYGYLTAKPEALT